MIFQNYTDIIANGQTKELQQKRQDILEILSAACDSVNPTNAVEKIIVGDFLELGEKTIALPNFNNIFLVGFGKASAGMAQAVCDHIKVSKGVIITNDSQAVVHDSQVEIVLGGHPLPTQGSIDGAKKIMDIISLCTEDDLLIVLISGGGSALLCHPRISLEDLQQTTDLLLRSGADITEINTIRKHLSFVKGGQLVQNSKGTMVSLVISDIVGDPLEFIASGPTYPDSTTYSDAKQIFEHYQLWTIIPVGVRTIIDQGIACDIPETVKQDNPVFLKVYHSIVANNEIACNSAIQKAKDLGYKTMLLTTSLTGEAKEMGKFISDKASHFFHQDQKWAFVAGGETTVTLSGHGKGGRNQELVLGAVEKIARSNVTLASFATDGIDGTSDTAGAIADNTTLKRAAQLQIHPADFLTSNNSFEFFQKIGDLFVTGPTGTNVMDIQIILM